MPTQEERLANLERKVAALELRRLYDERKAEERTPAAQAANLEEINENMTILLGIASGQEMSIKEMQRDVSALKEDVSAIEVRLGRLETKVDQHTAVLEQHTSILNQHTVLLNQILDRLSKMA